MTSLLNIGRCHADDPFYRYQMPPIAIKQESRGNGCKTVLPNISIVSLALAREPEALARYIGKKLATQVKYKDGSATLRGHFDRLSVQAVVDDFVDENVLCGKCTNPETTLEIKKRHIRLICKACGNKTELV